MRRERRAGARHGRLRTSRGRRPRSRRPSPPERALETARSVGRSVVDAGCGDWEFSQAIDWSGIDYKGYDIVASVIAADKAKFAKPDIHFFVANIVDTDLPPADLLIVKHVLQHLPTADVQRFLRQLPKYKHTLIVDSVSRDTLSAKNADTAAGGFRPLDVTRPPFSVRGTKVLTYWDGGNMQQVVYVPGPT